MEPVGAGAMKLLVVGERARHLLVSRLTDAPAAERARMAGRMVQNAEIFIAVIKSD
jgi:hypothetical protein